LILRINVDVSPFLKQRCIFLWRARIGTNVVSLFNVHLIRVNTKQSHSHPGTITHYNESVPSGHYKNERGNPLSLMPFTVNGKKVGDAANGIWVKSKKGFSNTLFEVHAPGNKTITTYDGINRAKIRNN
jgi:hypothetical protein